MNKIKIITDSLSDIPKKLADELNITVVPLTVRFGTEEYKDGIDITNEDFYRKVEKSEEIPSTSQVPPSEFKSAYEKALEEGYEYIIVINGSSRVSGTHQSAILAKNELDNENIHVIDSRSLSFGCGMIVVKAARMIKENKSIDEVLEEINKMVDGAEQIFSVLTLKYLHKNGRLSTSKMVLGNLLNVKPILAIVDGVVEPIDKVRGSKKLIKKMIEISKERGLKEGSMIGIGHACDIDRVEDLKREVENNLNPEEIIVSEIGPTIGTHAGPGTLAIFFIR